MSLNKTYKINVLSLNLFFKKLAGTYIHKIVSLYDHPLMRNPMARFGTQKVLSKEKNIKENDFLMFSFTVKNIYIKNQI